MHNRVVFGGVVHGDIYRGNQLPKLALCIKMLNMQLRTRHAQAVILILLFSVVVQTRRVIRAAPGIPTTGQYMVVLANDTSHERFEAIAEEVQSNSLSSKIQKIEGPFTKMIVAKFSIDEAHMVSFKTHAHTHTHI